MDPPPPPPPPPPPRLPPRPNDVTWLLSNYIDHIDFISRHLSSLLSALNTARSLNQPLHRLLQIPEDHSQPPRSDQVFFDAFNRFETNPFTQSHSEKLFEMQQRVEQLYLNLRYHLRRLRRTHPRSLFPQYAIRDTLDYIFSLFSPPNDQFPAKFTKHIHTAAMESFGVCDTLNTIRFLFEKLLIGLDNERRLIEFGLEMGRTDAKVIKQAVKELLGNLENLLDVMEGLKVYLECCLATLDAAKARVQQEIRRLP